MTSHAWTRPVHRALSLAFMALVLANLGGLMLGWKSQVLWVVTLIPLFGLMGTGAWLFVAPYLIRRRA